VYLLFDEIDLDRQRSEEIEVAIATPSGVLSGRAILIGSDPFGIVGSGARNGLPIAGPRPTVGR
jgi:hypothetical protein